MQIFFWPKSATIALFVLLWPIFQVGFAMLSNKITDEKFNENSWFYKAHKWENDGKIYNNVFKIRVWKHLLPDGAKLFKKGFEKRQLVNLDEDYLECFIKETCRAEWGHWMQIIPFWIFGLFAPFYVVFIMLAYTLAMNIPCIIAQRYNRPRMKKLLEETRKKNTNQNS